MCVCVLMLAEASRERTDLETASEELEFLARRQGEQRVLLEEQLRTVREKYTHLREYTRGYVACKRKCLACAKQCGIDCTCDCRGRMRRACVLL